MLDKNQPYAEVCGDSPAKYRQNGKYYDPQGREIDPETGVLTNPGTVPDPPKFVEEAADDVTTEPDQDDLELMSWQRVKALVLENGGEWIDRTTGIEFLRSL